ncbi:MAG: LptF/LptG family permease, partial [Fusobacterium sp.]
MKMINRYILNEAKAPIFFGISLFTFIFLIDIIVSMLESIIVKGISIIDVTRMISFYLPMILSQTIPMGIFLGVMVTFGSLTKYSEITAINSMGISLNKILKLISIVGVIGTLFIFFLQESIIPRSYIKLQQLSIKMVYSNPVFQLKEKVLIDEVDKYKIYIDKI